MGNRNRSGGSASPPGDALYPYTKPARNDAGMKTRTEPPAIASRYGSTRWRWVGYWLATAVVTGELALGGTWDIARVPFVADLVRHLGYPSYFLVLLGSWKVLAAVALLIRAAHCSRNGPMQAPSSPTPGRSSPTWLPATTSPRWGCWPS